MALCRCFIAKGEDRGGGAGAEKEGGGGEVEVGVGMGCSAARDLGLSSCAFRLGGAPQVYRRPRRQLFCAERASEE